MAEKRPPIVKIEVRITRIDESERAQKTPRLLTLQPVAPTIQTGRDSQSVQMTVVPIEEELNKAIAGLSALAEELKSYLG